MTTDPRCTTIPADSARAPSRREVLALGGAALSHLWMLSFLRARPASGSEPAIERAWGRIEPLSDGVWAVVSTPFAADDWTTICNGGIVAGTDRVLMIEAFARDEGARAVAAAARELTGRWPTDVVVTHFHADHVGGLAGLVDGGRAPRLWLTEKTRELVRDEDRRREIPEAGPRAEMLDAATLLVAEGRAELDLGGLEVEIASRSGHTPSDVTVKVASASALFAGDLVWNGLFPNYRDALPRRLSRAVEALRSESVDTFVSGHGPASDRKAFELYATVIEDLGVAARRAIERGIPAKEAAAAYELPPAAADWVLFNPAYFEVAIGAWMREAGSG
jgi:glyoxylase-like metal-dependent hydrolase (beta-lactamase superfamily II)